MDRSTEATTFSSSFIYVLIFFLSFYMTAAEFKIECGSWGVFKLKMLNLKMKQIKTKHPFCCPHTLRSSSNEEQTARLYVIEQKMLMTIHPVQSRVPWAMSKVRCTASEGVSSIHLSQKPCPPSQVFLRWKFIEHLLCVRTELVTVSTHLEIFCL